MKSIPFHTLRTESYFYFIRHGESVGNASGVVQGHAESPLSRRGKMQAQAAGKWCARERFDVIYSSPIGRAQETAHIIAARCKVPCHTHELAREIDTGAFSNMTWQEVRDAYPKEYRRFRVESWEAVPKAEKIATLSARARDYWQHLIAHANGGTPRIATVAHGGILQWFIKASMGAAETWMPLIPARNCAIFMLHVRPESYSATEGTRHGAYCAWRYMNFVPYGWRTHITQAIDTLCLPGGARRPH